VELETLNKKVIALAQEKDQLQRSTREVREQLQSSKATQRNQTREFEKTRSEESAARRAAGAKHSQQLKSLKAAAQSRERHVRKVESQLKALKKQNADLAGSLESQGQAFTVERAAMDELRSENNELQKRLKDFASQTLVEIQRAEDRVAFEMKERFEEALRFTEAEQRRLYTQLEAQTDTLKEELKHAQAEVGRVREEQSAVLQGTSSSKRKGSTGGKRNRENRKETRECSGRCPIRNGEAPARTRSSTEKSSRGEVKNRYTPKANGTVEERKCTIQNRSCC